MHLGLGGEAIVAGRVVIQVYAKPENFESVAALIRERAQDAVIKMRA